jgi:ribose 5-phosphate isomerase B
MVSYDKIAGRKQFSPISRCQEIFLSAMTQKNCGKEEIMTPATEETPVLIGASSNGFELKESVKKMLGERGIPVKDASPDREHSEDDSSAIAARISYSISSGIYRKGIIISGTGLVSTIVSNRFPDVRATLCTNPDLALTARWTLDGNVLILPSKYLRESVAHEIVNVWLNAQYGDNATKHVTQLINDITRQRIAFSHMDRVVQEEMPIDSAFDRLVLRAGKFLRQAARTVLPTSERRKKGQVRQVQTCPVQVVYDGQQHNALLVNVSEQGAQMKLEQVSSVPLFVLDDEVELSIRTPYGVSVVKGQIRWFDKKEATFGVSMTDTPGERDDPLNLLLDSML